MLIGHKKQRTFLEKKFLGGQLSHAYLLAGAKEIGKKAFAVEFVKFLNCLSERNKPCQKCVNCQMIEKNSFPDFMVVGAPEKDEKYGDGGEIKISKIRQVNNFLNYKPYYGLYKTVLIGGAERMNQEAQSCLLKTLEEPKGRALLMLVSAMPDLLLSTIVSRCQTVKFFKPKNFLENPEKVKKEKEILQKLLSLMESSLAERFKYVKSIDFQKQKLEEILEVVQKYFRGLLLSKTGVFASIGQASTKYSTRKIKDIINLTEDISSKLLFSHINPNLALEILLMEL